MLSYPTDNQSEYVVSRALKRNFATRKWNEDSVHKLSGQRIQDMVKKAMLINTQYHICDEEGQLKAVDISRQVHKSKGFYYTKSHIYYVEVPPVAMSIEAGDAVARVSKKKQSSKLAMSK